MFISSIFDFDIGIRIFNALGNAFGGFTDFLMLIPTIVTFTGAFVSFLPNILAFSLSVSLVIGAFKVITGAA